MFEISVQAVFSAAHRLVDYPGNCARWHGHNWTVTVVLQAGDLNRLGMAMDFREAKSHLKTVLEDLDHTDLNQFPALAGQNPTSEVIARWVYQQMAARCTTDTVRVARVQVAETPETCAVYYE